MDDDLEEELLAVAGRSQGGSKKRRKAAASSDEDYEVEPQKRLKSKPTRSRRQAFEMEEDSESEFDDGYGSDLMADEEDRARLAAMNELDRELVLAERAEKRDEMMERRQTARVLKQQQQAAAKASNMRSSTRSKGNDMAKKSAMAELVAAKNARARKAGKEEGRRRRRDEEDEEEVSDESEYEVSDRSERGAASEDKAASSQDLSRDQPQEDGFSDIEEDEEDGVLTRQHEDDEAEEAELKNINDIKVKRRTLEKWLNEPFFERSLPGAVVRIAVGSNRYFMAQIVHVEERNPGAYKDPGIYRIQSPYEFPADKGSTTSKWLYVQRGTSPRLMPMTLVSNGDISEDEFRSWRDQCNKDNRPQISTTEADEVKDRLQKAHTYVYTAEDVAKMVEEKRARGEITNIAKEKSRLVVQKAKALEDGDTEAAEMLQAQIADLDLKADQKAQREKERLKDREAAEGRKTLAEVNKQNALRNMENALKNISSRPEGSRSLTVDGIDPFSRRPTRPMNYWSTKRNIAGALAEKSRQESLQKDEEDNAEADFAGPATATATENAAGGIDLNIDLTILEGNPGTALLTNRLLGPHWASRLPTRQDFAGRKVLTLTDYKRRQGIV